MPRPTQAAGQRSEPIWRTAVERWLRRDASASRLLQRRPRPAPPGLNAAAAQVLHERLRRQLQPRVDREASPDPHRITHRRAGLRLLLGQEAETLLQLAAAWTAAARAAGVPLPMPRLQTLALDVLSTPTEPPVPSGYPVAQELANFAARAWSALAPLVPQASRTVVRDALWQQLQGGTAIAEPAPFEPGVGALQTGEHALVADAGLVLCAPFLPRLWQRLGLLRADGQAFATSASAARAVQLMRLLATGRTDTPEHLLVLPRLLCALPEHLALDAELQPTPAEREALDGLLLAMIRHWQRLGRTSPAGLRETFLSRPGQLERADTHWRLRVESRPFDMLLDDLPWSFKTVRLPWMPEVLHVEWR